MPRQADASHLQVQPPSQFHIQYRKRNRNAFTIIDDLIEVAICAIVIITTASVVAVLFEHVLAKCRQPFSRIGVFRQLGANLRRHFAHLLFIMRQINVRIIQLADKQRRTQQIHLRIILFEFRPQRILHRAFVHKIGQSPQLPSLRL